MSESWVVWMIERGQPEGHTPPIYAVSWEGTSDDPTTKWTSDPWSAAHIPDREEAERLIGLWNAAPARAVEHSFTCEHREVRCEHCRRRVSTTGTAGIDVRDEAEQLLADIQRAVSNNRSWATYYSRVMALLTRLSTDASVGTEPDA